ncbi:hypothetical protein V1460_25545 [Streptomyces sp. SCSIO 30461]|uniref:hypothetical protein n=1 Tax=Streptomyces sp. SCSIO 30461 TaxID=3118085 RepID=UPI0030CBEEEA
MEVRYTGGLHIEMTPAEQNNWKPVIELAASGRTLTRITTKWLMGRCNGWELAVFEALGVTGVSQDSDPARTAWVQKHRPPYGKECIVGNWQEWIYEAMRNGWQSGRMNEWTDLGGYERPVGSHPPLAHAAHRRGLQAVELHLERRAVRLCLQPGPRQAPSEEGLPLGAPAPDAVRAPGRLRVA